MAAGHNLSWPVILLIFFLAHPMNSSSSSPPTTSETDIQILMKFKTSLQNIDELSDWKPSVPPCTGDYANWTGIICNNGTIWGLKLQNMGLRGSIDVDALKDLPNLRTMSFMNNKFEGVLPDLKKLGAIKTMYFSDNGFYGEIPGDAFEGMDSLKKIHLARNRFSGKIPYSLTGLEKLVELSLEENRFEGEIPAFRQKRLRLLNVSDNDLEGQIPTSLGKMDKSLFSGNKNLCGQPLQPCYHPPTLSLGIVIIVVILVVAALAAILAVIVILPRRRRAPPPEEFPDVPKSHQKIPSPDLTEQAPPTKKAEQGGGGKLTFLRDDRERFELPDLLRASAEVLGSGAFGSSYKAAVAVGPVVVVKRFRQMNNVGREEFQEHMRRLGRLRHRNLLPLVAFYYRKEEKLLVSDYVDNASLAVYLHGNGEHRQQSSDWPIRFKIIKGIARGLLYLYNELPSLISPHGHLKSSNVLLNKSFDPLLTDYGLSPLVNQENAQDLMIAYKSPEYRQLRRITKKTDVWSLGILMLEILTGKSFPSNFLQQRKGSEGDVEGWVESVVGGGGEGWLAEEEVGGRRRRETVVKLLKIGVCCCESDVEKRWDMREAVEKIEEVGEEEDGDEELT